MDFKCSVLQLVSGSFSRLSFLWFFFGFLSHLGALGGVILVVFLKSVGFVVKRGTLDSEQPVQRFCMILGVRASPKGEKYQEKGLRKLAVFLLLKKIPPGAILGDFGLHFRVSLEPQGAQ